MITNIQNINYDGWHNVHELDCAGKTAEAFSLLQKLANDSDPFALLELSMRYASTDGYVVPVEPMEQDLAKSQSLAILSKKKFEEYASKGDGEAMRMLANFYMGLWHPVFEKSCEKAEKLLLEAISVGHYFAANDLATYYQGSSIDKAKYYYQLAEEHNCRVVYNKNLE